MSDIAGYDYGTSRAARSPVTLEELRALQASIGFTASDAAALRQAHQALGPQAEAMVDHWRAEIARQPHLVQWFFGPDGAPDDRYRAAVKRRFVPMDQRCLHAAARPGMARLSRGNRAAAHAREEEPYRRNRNPLCRATALFARLHCTGGAERAAIP